MKYQFESSFGAEDRLKSVLSVGPNIVSYSDFSIFLKWLFLIICLSLSSFNVNVFWISGKSVDVDDWRLVKVFSHLIHLILPFGQNHVRNHRCCSSKHPLPLLIKLGFTSSWLPPIWSTAMRLWQSCGAQLRRKSGWTVHDCVAKLKMCKVTPHHSRSYVVIGRIVGYCDYCVDNPNICTAILWLCTYTPQSLRSWSLGQRVRSSHSINFRSAHFQEKKSYQ